MVHTSHGPTKNARLSNVAEKGKASSSLSTSGNNCGVVVGWGGDEDEDVSIDSHSDEDGGEDQLPMAEEGRRAELRPRSGVVDSPRKPKLRGMRANTELPGAASIREDSDGVSEDQAPPRSSVRSPRAARDQGRSSGVRWRAPRSESNAVRTGSSSGWGLGSGRSGASAPGGEKRLDARSFRRAVNDQISEISNFPVRNKSSASDEDQTRCDTDVDANRKKFAKVKAEEGRNGSKSGGSTNLPKRHAVERESRNELLRDHDSGKKSARDEKHNKREVLERLVQQKNNKDEVDVKANADKKRKSLELEQDQSVKDNSTSQGGRDATNEDDGKQTVGNSSKDSSSRLRQGGAAFNTAKSPRSSKRARTDDSLPIGKVVIKGSRTSTRRGLDIEGKSQAQGNEVGDEDVRPESGSGSGSGSDSKAHHVKESDSTETSRSLLPRTRSHGSDVEPASRTSERENLSRVSKRRSSQNNDGKEKTDGEEDAAFARSGRPSDDESDHNIGTQEEGKMDVDAAEEDAQMEVDASLEIGKKNKKSKEKGKPAKLRRELLALFTDPALTRDFGKDKENKTLGASTDGSGPSIRNSKRSRDIERGNSAAAAGRLTRGSDKPRMTFGRQDVRSKVKAANAKLNATDTAHIEKAILSGAGHDKSTSLTTPSENESKPLADGDHDIERNFKGQSEKIKQSDEEQNDKVTCSEVVAERLDVDAGEVRSEVVKTNLSDGPGQQDSISSKAQSVHKPASRRSGDIWLPKNQLTQNLKAGGTRTSVITPKKWLRSPNSNEASSSKAELSSPTASTELPPQRTGARSAKPSSSLSSASRVQSKVASTVAVDRSVKQRPTEVSCQSNQDLEDGEIASENDTQKGDENYELSNLEDVPSADKGSGSGERNSGPMSETGKVAKPSKAQRLEESQPADNDGGDSSTVTAGENLSTVEHQGPGKSGVGNSKSQSLTHHEGFSVDNPDTIPAPKTLPPLAKHADRQKAAVNQAVEREAESSARGGGLDVSGGQGQPSCANLVCSLEDRSERQDGVGQQGTVSAKDDSDVPNLISCENHGVGTPPSVTSHSPATRRRDGQNLRKSGDKVDAADKCGSDDGTRNDSHNSFCCRCEQGGELICCDGRGCRNTMHLECTDPKLVDVPSGNWYCPTCAHKRESYGLHAISKSVESIWKVKSRGSRPENVEPPDENSEKEYFVKWKGICHARNTWVPESELVKVSPKGLTRFKKKVAEGQVMRWDSDWTEPQRIVDKRLAKVQVERTRQNATGTDPVHEWFIKWKGLGYDQCTWESVHSGVLSQKQIRELEATYDRWHEEAHKRRKSEHVEQVQRRREGVFKKLESKPEWLRVEQLLRYQLDGLNRLRERWQYSQNTIILDEDDQEKASIVMAFLLSLIEGYEVYRPILVVVPLFELQNWEAEVSEYAPQLNTVVYAGSKEARCVIQDFELNRSKKPSAVQIVLTTYETASTDIDHLRTFNWEAIIIDESLQSKLAKSHRSIFQIEAAFWLFVINDLSKYNVDDLQQVLRCLKPRKPDGQKQMIGVSESFELQDLLAELSIYTVKDMKPATRRHDLHESWIATEMTLLQAQTYCNILIKNYGLLHSGRMRNDPDSLSLHDVLQQLCLCCQHPYLADPTAQGTVKQDVLPRRNAIEAGVAASNKFFKLDILPTRAAIDAGIEASMKWQLIHAMLPICVAYGYRLIIVSQALMLLFFLDDYMRLNYGPDSYELVDTRYSTLRKSSAARRFNAKDSSRFVFLLRKGASGFSLKLKDGDMVIFHESDLNPQNDTNFLRKILHNDSYSVEIFRLFQRSTIEEGALALLRRTSPDLKPPSPSLKVIHNQLKWNVRSIFKLAGFSEDDEGNPRSTEEQSDRGSTARRAENLATTLLTEDFEPDEPVKSGGDDWSGSEEVDSLKEFWAILLKDRYAAQQKLEEELNAGKGLRLRRRVQYNEEALALAPYSAVKGNESNRKRKRSQLLRGAPTVRGKAAHLSQASPLSLQRLENVGGGEGVASAKSQASPLSLQRPENVGGGEGLASAKSQATAKKNSQHAVVEPVHKPSTRTDSPGKGLTFLDGAKGEQSHSSKDTVGGPEPSSSVQSDSGRHVRSGSNAIPTLEEGRRLRIEQQQMLQKMEPELIKICGILDLPERTTTFAARLLGHIMRSYRMPSEPRDLIIKLEISLCLVAATRLGLEMDHVATVERVYATLGVPIGSEVFQKTYERLQVMCETFKEHPTGCEVGLPGEVSPHETLGGKVLKPSDKQDRDSQMQVESLPEQRVNHRKISSINLSDSDPVEQPPRASLETVLPSEDEQRVLLKSQRDALYNYWITKQKAEMQELNANWRRKKLVQPVISSAADATSESRNKLLEWRSTLEQKERAERLEVTEKQRAIRDKINTLYTTLLGQATMGKRLNLFEEARSRGLAVPDMQPSANVLPQGSQVHQQSTSAQMSSQTPVQQSRDSPPLIAVSVGQPQHEVQHAPAEKHHVSATPTQAHTEPHRRQQQQTTPAQLPSQESIDQSQDPPSPLIAVSEGQPQHQLQHPPAEQDPIPATLPQASPDPPVQQQQLVAPAQMPSMTPVHQSQDSPAPLIAVLSDQPQDEVQHPSAEEHPVAATHSQSQSEPQVQQQQHVTPAQIFSMTSVQQSREPSPPLIAVLASQPPDQVQHPPAQEHPVSATLPEAQPEPLLQQSSGPVFNLHTVDPPLSQSTLQPTGQASFQSSPRSLPLSEHQVSTSLPSQTQFYPQDQAGVQLSSQSVESNSTAIMSSQDVSLPRQVSQPVSQADTEAQPLSQSISELAAQAISQPSPRSVSHVEYQAPSLRSHGQRSGLSGRQSVGQQPGQSDYQNQSHVQDQPGVQLSSQVLESTSAAVRPLQHVSLPQASPAVAEDRLEQSQFLQGPGQRSERHPHHPRPSPSLQNVPMLAQASIAQMADPLVQEEIRLRTEQEKAQEFYKEEVRQIKAQYDREALELRRKFEMLLKEKARVLDEKSASLSENLVKVERNRLLAEALKMRAQMDLPKGRQGAGQSPDATSANSQGAHPSTSSSAASPRLHPGQQANAAEVRSGRIVEDRIIGPDVQFTEYLASPTPNAAGRQYLGPQTIPTSGRSTPFGGDAQVQSGNTSRGGTWHSSNASHHPGIVWQNTAQSGPIPGFAARAGSAPNLGNAPNVQLSPRTSSSVPVLHPSQIQMPSSTIPPNLFQGVVDRGNARGMLPDHIISLAWQQWSSQRNGTNGAMISSSPARAEDLVYQNVNPGNLVPRRIPSSNPMNVPLVTEAVVVTDRTDNLALQGPQVRNSTLAVPANVLRDNVALQSPQVRNATSALPANVLRSVDQAAPRVALVGNVVAGVNREAHHVVQRIVGSDPMTVNHSSNSVNMPHQYGGSPMVAPAGFHVNTVGGNVVSPEVGIPVGNLGDNIVGSTPVGSQVTSQIRAPLERRIDTGFFVDGGGEGNARSLHGQSGSGAVQGSTVGAPLASQISVPLDRRIDGGHFVHGGAESSAGLIHGQNRSGSVQASTVGGLIPGQIRAHSDRRRDGANFVHGGGGDVNSGLPHGQIRPAAVQASTIGSPSTGQMVAPLDRRRDAGNFVHGSGDGNVGLLHGQNRSGAVQASTVGPPITSQIGAPLDRRRDGGNFMHGGGGEGNAGLLHGQNRSRAVQASTVGAPSTSQIGASLNRMVDNGNFMSRAGEGNAGLLHGQNRSGAVQASTVGPEQGSGSSHASVIYLSDDD